MQPNKLIITAAAAAAASAASPSSSGELFEKTFGERCFLSRLAIFAFAE